MLRYLSEFAVRLISKVRLWFMLVMNFISASFVSKPHKLFQCDSSKLQGVLNIKSRDITLPTKVRLVKAMVFPVVMYGCESWTVKKAECRRINAFELWCWRRLLRVLTARFDCKEVKPIHPKGNQS